MYIWGPIRMWGARTSQAEEVYTPFVAGEEGGSLWFETSKGRRATHLGLEKPVFGN